MMLTAAATWVEKARVQVILWLIPRPTNIPSPGQPNPVLTKFSIWNNNLGLNTDYSIRVFKTYNTFLPGNIICNNTGSIIVADGVNWSKDCSNLKN